MTRDDLDAFIDEERERDPGFARHYDAAARRDDALVQIVDAISDELVCPYDDVGAAVRALFLSGEGRSLLREALGDEHAGWLTLGGALLSAESGRPERGDRRVWAEGDPGDV